MSNSTQWQDLALNNFNDLIEAREQLHQAVQIVAMVARSLNPKVSDDHYANLDWSPQYQAFVGRCILDKDLSVALRPHDFNLLILDDSGIRCHLSLSGNTQEKAIDFIQDEFKKLGVDPNKFSMELPYEIPTYETSKGQAFDIKKMEAFQELARYFANTNLVLQSVIKEEHSANEIRIWPHHFDISTLITVEAHDDPEKAKTVGLGLSPGDEHVAEPYFYITPWPYPDLKQVNLPELAVGTWHTDGWVGNVLKASEVLASENQMKIACDFVGLGVPAAKSVL